MKRLTQGLLTIILLALLGAVPARAQHGVTVHMLVQEPERYDRKVVTVVGTITAYRERVSDAGNPFTTFRLADGDASVAVFIWNKQGLSNGQRVRVTGACSNVRQPGTFAIEAEIQAHRIEVVR